MSSKSFRGRKPPPPPPPTPPPDDKTEVLLAFFESEHFDEWVAISNLWRSNNDGVVDYLCNRLLSLSDERLERYLNQIITLQILRPTESLERTILGFCKRSIRLGTQTCWLLAAAAGDSKKPDPIMALRDACEQAALSGEWHPPFTEMSPMLDTPLHMDDLAGRASARLSGMARSRAASADAEDAVSPAAALRELSVSGDGAEDKDNEPAVTSSQRVDTFGSTLQLAEDLCGLSTKLSTVFPPEGRQGQLRAGIERVSDALVEGHAPGAGVMFPMGEMHSRVVRIPACEAVLLNSREKAPYLLCLEVIAAPGDLGSGDGSPKSSRRGSTPRHSRESSDSLPLHDMSTPLWSTHDFLSGVNGVEHVVEHRASSSAASTFSGSQNSGPLHPGLNNFASGLTSRRDQVGAVKGLPRAGSSYSSLSDAHESIDEDQASAPNEALEAIRRTSQSGRPPLSPATTSPAGSPTAGAVARHTATGIFSGGAVGVKPSHYRTKSFETISKKVDVALAQVWRGDEPVVRASIAVHSGRNSAASSMSGKSDASELEDDKKVRVTLFVENPAPPKSNKPRALGGHHRTPSDVGLAEMASSIKLTGGGRTFWAAPAEARDATSAPNATPTSPLRPRSAGPESFRAPAAQQVPSPWKRSAGGLGENWEDKVERVRASSPYGNLPGWALKPVIIKAGDNCRQELLAIQMTRAFAKIYADSGLPLWLRPFDVIATSTTTAFIEAVTDAPSIHAVKSRAPRDTSLRKHFELKFGKGGTPGYRTAQRNFVESLAGYSVLTYILQVKDRHNGNILLHDDGHLIHIDFNFMLSTSPGGINFESSPFKLTREYLEVMDSDDTGMASEAFNYYKVLCIQGYLAVRKHAERIITLVEMMSASGCPCFKAGPKVLSNLRRRFNLGCTEEQCVEIMLSMISDSMDAWCTRQYDFYQRVLNGIL